jgi:hypothetical protein
MSTTVKKTPKKTQTSKKQNFIRLNVDENLEKLLQKYEQKYTLLTRSDIIRMLLSEVDWQKTTQKTSYSQKSFQQILADSNFVDIKDEDKQFEYLSKHGLL